jgi:hypothetical protein
MKRLVTLVTAVLVLSVPTALAAPPEGKGKPESPGKSAAAPGQSETKNAAKKCKAMRADNKATFEQQYGIKPNAFGKCVAAQEKKAEEQEEAREAKENAAKKCKKLRADPTFASSHGGKTFAEFYGTNANKANAFGKCVSTHAKEKLES